MHNRARQRAVPQPAYDPMDGMADSVAREALTSHPAFKRSQQRVADHLKKTAKKLTRGFMASGMPMAAKNGGPRRRESIKRGASRGAPYRSH